MRCAGWAALVVLFGAASGFAQQETGQIQQLKSQLQQVEQQMQQLADVTRRLQGQIAELEMEQNEPPPAVSAAPVTAPPAQLPVTDIGNETRTRQTDNDFAFEAPRINNEELDPTLRGYFRVPGTQALIRLTGFVKADFFYDTSYTGLWYGGLVPSSFPATPQPNSADSTVSIRPSRFTAEFRQALGDDTLKGFVDWDTYGTNGTTTLRLRSFWGQYKNFLAGQTWSAFGDPDAFPDTLDFAGPPGMMGIRTPQFRYTYPLTDHNSIGASVEKSGTDAPFFTVYGVPIPTSTRPDIVAFYHYENRYGHIHTAAIFRSVGGFIPDTTIPDLSRHTAGYGASFSGAWRFGRSRDNIVFQGIGGKGISNYYSDNYGLGSDVGFAADGRLVATPSWSATVGYQHYWTKIIRSTASYGRLQINNTAADPPTNYHISNYATGNIIVQPSALYLLGAEYSYGSLERKDNFEWIGRRIQLSVSFFFNRYSPE